MKFFWKCAALGAVAVTGLAFGARAETITIARGQSPQEALAAQAFEARVASSIAAHGGPARVTSPGAPVIVSGAVLSSTLIVGSPTSYPVMNFRYKTGPEGLVGAQFVFTAPSGYATLTVAYFPGHLTTSGDVTFSNGFLLPAFLQPGAWKLSSALIADYSGAYTQYTGASLTKRVFPASVKVINKGPRDYTPPVVTAGRVLTPTVSLSKPLPQFRASLTANDNVSGYDVAYILIQPPGAPFSFTNFVNQSFPVKSGTFVTVANLPAGYPAGTWGIGGYGACDLAGNCVFDQYGPDVQALFGTTTFTVTQ